jgi:soluble lytic murein transglycosylase-like protein
MQKNRLLITSIASINRVPWVAWVAWLAWSLPAHAGKQAEEPVADAVRVSLSQAIADTTVPRYSPRDAADRQQYQAWLDTADARLALRRKDLSPFARQDLLATVYFEATRAGLEPALVLGLIQVESNFRTFAISSASARGLMQVMPFWTRLVGDGNLSRLFDSPINLRYGCSIYRHYLAMEKGNHFRALGRYNGSLGKPEYPNAVLAAWQQWK